MTLYLHPNSDYSLREAYVSAFKSADEIFVLSAYLRDWQDFELSSACENATIIVGKDFGITRKQALSSALKWKIKNGSSCHLYVSDKIDGFHPKVVMWRRGGKYFLIIGSSNLTISAFESNIEANIRIMIDETKYNQICDWIADILGCVSPVDQGWIDSYQECLPPKQSSKKSTKPLKSTHSSLVLPRFPGLAKAISERKEKVKLFDEIRQDFEEMLNKCAGKLISNQECYDWLIDNWNKNGWKFQGNGVFRQPINATDWHVLCSSLLKCVNARNDRDEVVVRCYDYMEKLGTVAVRKSFLTEMLCHFFPNDYPLWNNPVKIWIKKQGAKIKMPRGLSEGEKYIWLSKQLRLAMQGDPNYPAANLAELDHVIWAYCFYKGWIKTSDEVDS